VSTAPRSHALFETALGSIALAWSEAGLLGVQLPEATPEGTQQKLAARARSTAAKPPVWVRAAAKSMRALVEGRRSDLSGLRLDLDLVPEFHGRVYAALRKLKPGETCTYQQLAAAAGSPGAARAVGQAMRRNPWPLVVPCHRVLGAKGRLGGFSAYGGPQLKARLLEAEQPRTARASRPRGARLARPAPQPSSAARTAPALAQASPVAQASPASALAHLRGVDPRLGALIERVPFELKAAPLGSVFEALLRTIVYQQLNGKAAATIHARVLELLPRGEADARALLALAPEQLRAAGLSRSKAASAIDLAQKSLSGELPTVAQLQQLDDEQIVERLTVVRGIGRWSVEMLLMFRLGRPDVLPLGDFGVKHGFMLLMGRRTMPSSEQLARHGERWRPYRSAAAWYLWRAVDEHRARVPEGRRRVRQDRSR